LDHPRLSVAELQELASALLDCDCIRNKRARESLLDSLRDDPVGKHVNVSRQDLDRADVIGILSAFARHSGGLTTLLSGIELYEPGTVAVGKLRVLIERIEPDPLVPVDQYSLLQDLLPRIDCPDAETLYWKAVGTFGPAPTGPNRDLASLVRDLSDVNSTGPLPPLLIFLELVALKALAHRQALRQWIDSHAAHWNLDSDEIFRNRLALGTGEHLTADEKSYLVVQLEPYGADPQWYLPSAWFQQSGTSRKLQLSEEPVLAENLAQILHELLTNDAEVTRDAFSRLVVEVILPRKLINKDVDQLMIAPEGFPRPIGTQHPVVVRPFERMQNPALHREWQRKWSWLKRHGDDPRAAALGMHWIMRPAEVEPWQLLVQLMAEDTPVYIIMAFPTPESDTLGLDEYAAGVHSGAPVMLWCRDGQPPESFEQEVRALLANHGLQMLPELVHRYRKLAHYPGAPPAHLGRRLTLLWDDFDRKPEESNSLLAPTRGPK
jgi:hypothetical protein